jgi:hypothetical protein
MGGVARRGKGGWKARNLQKHAVFSCKLTLSKEEGTKERAAGEKRFDRRGERGVGWETSNFGNTEKNA